MLGLVLGVLTITVLGLFAFGLYAVRAMVNGFKLTAKAIEELEEQMADDFQEIEDDVQAIVTAVAGVSDEVDAILAKLGSNDGGLTQAQVAQLHGQLGAVRDSLKATADKNPAPPVEEPPAEPPAEPPPPSE